MGDAIGDRMKGYERAARVTLPWRLPVIVRVDGKAFHTWTRGLERPFSPPLVEAMNQVAIALCKEMQGSALAFVQSDEISVLLHNYRSHDTSAWFDNQVQKIVSVSASIAAAVMTAESARVFGALRRAYFDARVFVLPEIEVVNYFLWRQQDATRNSIQMVAQSLYPQRELQRRSTADLQEMIAAKGQAWSAFPTHLKRGRCVLKETYQRDDVTRTRWVVDDEVPIFSEDRGYVERHLAVEEEAPAPAPC